MIHPTLKILEIVAVLGCLTSSAYYLLCLWSAQSFLRATKQNKGDPSTQAPPPVSILKPLKGTDPEMYETLRSHCLQDHPEYEIIFGVSDPDDPAVDVVQRLQEEFPHQAIRLVVCPVVLGANVKVSNLQQMLPSTRHSYLLVSDSDIRVERDYLRRVMVPFSDEGVGMVTCLYRGVADRTLGSRLESLGISTDFCPGVLVARQLEGGLHFGLGSTMAFRREDLDRIGGFRSIVDFLADDYELGQRISALGLRVHLADVVVETRLPAYDLRGFVSHQLRWARGVRDSRLGGYIGLVSTFGVMWGLLNLIAAHASMWSWTVFGIVALLRLAMALAVGKAVLRDGDLPGRLYLLPIRDLVAVAIWFLSFAGHSIVWRGDRFELKKGRLIRIAQ